MNPDGTQIQDDEEVAQAFREFFLNKVNKLNQKNPIPDEPECLYYSLIKPFNSVEIEKALSSFKPKKSSGPDEVPLLIFKSCFEPLLRPVMQLFNAIAVKGMNPKAWKLARFKPKFKKGAKDQIDNNHPISNLSSV
jgi:hypothetical protein